MSASRINAERPLAGPLNRILEDAQRRVLPDGQGAPSGNGGGAAAKSGRRARTPLHEGGFTPIPRVLDDFLIRLAKNPDTRPLARAFSPVVMDLARFTDTAHGDVIVTNQGLADRRGIGVVTVKATIKLLLSMGVLRKTEPSADRLQELKQLRGGFSRRRRYLVWNSQSRWRLPESPDGCAALAWSWSEYVGKIEKVTRVS